MTQSALITVITKAIEKASKPLLRDFGEVDKLQVSKKGTANFVSNADLRTERILVEELSHARKNWGFLTEESGEITGSDQEHRFVIDPIDGTSNFIHAVPYFCISVAAQRKNKNGEYESIAGVIFDPVHDEMFIAEKGQGAVMNRLKLRVSQREEDWYLSTTAPRLARNNLPEVEAAIDAVARSGSTVRCPGAAALDLAYVAAGRYDGLWFHYLQPWDIAAGSLLVQEAGGLVSCLQNAQGQSIAGSILASNGRIHKRLQSLLEPHSKAA